MAEVGGRSADVVDVALEPGLFGQQPALGEDGFAAARGHNAALMECQRAEAACAEAAAHRGDGEAHLVDRRHAAVVRIHRVPSADVGEGVDGIELRLRKRQVGDVLQKVAPLMLLRDGPAAHRILLGILHGERARIGRPVFCDGFRGLDLQKTLRDLARHDARPGNAHLRKRLFPAHPFGDAEDRSLAHAEHQHVRAAVDQNRVAHAVVPVVVVREAAQRSLDAADGDGHVGICLANAVAIDDRRAVGAPAGLAAGGIGVLAARLLRGGVVVDHRVDDAGGDQEADLRPAKPAEVLAGVPVRLRQHRHAIAGAFEHARDDRQPKRRMIDVGVAGHIDEVGRVPAALAHFPPCDGEKVMIHGIPPLLRRRAPARQSRRPRRA